MRLDVGLGVTEERVGEIFCLLRWCTVSTSSATGVCVGDDAGSFIVDSLTDSGIASATGDGNGSLVGVGIGSFPGDGDSSSREFYNFCFFET